MTFRLGRHSATDRYLHAIISSKRLQFSQIHQASGQITDFQILYLLCTDGCLRPFARNILKVTHANTVVSRWHVCHLAQAQWSMSQCLLQDAQAVVRRKHFVTLGVLSDVACRLHPATKHAQKTRDDTDAVNGAVLAWREAYVCARQPECHCFGPFGTDIGINAVMITHAG